MPKRLRDNAKIHIDYARNGNMDEFLHSGWSTPETEACWMIGSSSSVILPPFETVHDPYLIMRISPFGQSQRLIIVLNGIEIDDFLLTESSWCGFRIPPHIVGRELKNTLVFFHPDWGRPTEQQPDSGDTRALAISCSDILLADAQICEGSCLSSSLDQFEDQRATEPIGAKVSNNAQLANSYQSLGQNCEFGLFQRKCGTEPIGLLRFASIYIARLIHGIETEFDDIAAQGNLTLLRHTNGEWYGHHSFYGLDYHTFKYNDDIDPVRYLYHEKDRLTLLARVLMEQICGAEKIFVVQSKTLTLRKVIPLLYLLRLYNNSNKLLWVSEAESQEKVGSAEIVVPGLCRGQIDRLAPDENAHDLSFEIWLGICNAAITLLR